MSNLAVKQRKFTRVVDAQPTGSCGILLVTVETLADGSIKDYKFKNDVWYDSETPDQLIQILDGLYRSDVRCRFYLGDIETGRDWCQEYDVMGTVGRTCGEISRPILIANSRSFGGGIIYTDSIVKITEARGGRVLWKHPKYQVPEFEICHRGEKGFPEGYPEEYVSVVYRIEDGKEEKTNVAAFRKPNQAAGYVAFMRGETNSKAYGLWVAK